VSHHPLADLVAAGTRLTAQRTLIWNVLHQSGEHLTAEEIRDRVAARLPAANLPTVYRNLIFLRSIGLVQEVYVGDGAARFEAGEPGERRQHIVCRECGRIAHLDGDALGTLVDAAASAQGFEAPNAELVIYADCVACQQQPRAAAAL
jgi:Fe2+ or Zn2+ uptake regulation protein